VNNTIDRPTSLVIVQKLKIVFQAMIHTSRYCSITRVRKRTLAKPTRLILLQVKSLVRSFSVETRNGKNGNSVTSWYSEQVMDWVKKSGLTAVKHYSEYFPCLTFRNLLVEIDDYVFSFESCCFSSSDRTTSST